MDTDVGRSGSERADGVGVMRGTAERTRSSAGRNDQLQVCNAILAPIDQHACPPTAVTILTRTPS